MTQHNNDNQLDEILAEFADRSMELIDNRRKL